MFEYADAAVEGALAAGARYADARVMDRRHESMDARNGEIEALTQEGSVGLGVRALIGSGWGFFATADLSRDAAAGRTIEAGDQPQQRRLAAARGPQHRQELTGLDSQVDVGDGDHAAVELTTDASNLDGASRGRGSGS